MTSAHASGARADDSGFTDTTALPAPLSLLHRVVLEALGTFTLVVFGTGAIVVGAKTGTIGHAGVCTVFGLIVVVIIAAIGHRSGAHINPAVTVGLWSIRLVPSRDVVPYVAAQCAGAIAASAALAWLLAPVPTLGPTVPSIPLTASFVVEAGVSGVLAFVIVAVATDRRVPPAMVPLAIGATVGVGALVAGPLTGGSFNPARTLGPALVGGEFTAHWLYWVAPVVGMVAAMHLHRRMATYP